MLLIDRYRRLSLRAKFSLWVSAGASAIVVGLMLAILVALKHAATHSIGQVQAALVEGVARDVDGKMGMRLDALLREGAALGERLPIREGVALDAFFDSHPSLRHAFDTVALADADGRVVYDSTLPPGRPKPPMSDRPFFKEALRTGQVVIAPPLVSKLASAPIIAVAAPVKGTDGETAGVLVGLLRLDRPNFLSDVGDLRIGDGGYFVLATRGARPVIVAHPRRDRVLLPVAHRGDPDFSAQSHEPPLTVEGLDADGMPALLTQRALASGPWVIEAVYPEAEAFAGLRQQQRLVLGVGAAIAALSWALVWWLSTALLAPMHKLRVALQLDATGSGHMLQTIRADSTDMAALLEAYHAQKTRRLATENELAASERRLRQIADHLPAFVAYIDKKRVYRFANAHSRVLYGLEPNEILGKTLAERLGSERYERISERVTAVLNGQAQTFEHSVAGHAGCEHLLVSYVPDVAPDGRVAGFYAMALDITARKRAELLLTQSERRLKSITDSLPAMIAVVDREQRYRFANARFRELLKVDPGAVIGQTMLQLLGPETHAKAEPAIAAALRGERRRFERTGARDGVEKHLLVEYVPDIEADGTVSGFVLMALDLTERRRTELALAQSEQRVRTLTDSLPALILHYDRELRYTFANAKAGEAFGFDPASVIGKSLREVRGERVHAELAPRMSRALAGEPVSFESTNRLGDGPPQSFECNYVPEFDTTGQVVGFYALTFDITQRKRNEAQLRASERLLDRIGATAGIGGWSVELDAGTVVWTDRTRRIHEVDPGYEPSVEQAIEFYVGDGRPAIEQAVQRGMERGEPWDLVLPLVTAKGRSIWVRATGEVEFEDGRPLRMFGAFQDVSLRVNHERQLREQAELLHVTLKSIGDGVITADENGCVRWMNPAAERMTGWTSEAAVGRPTADVFRIVHAETRVAAPDPVAVCLQTLGPAGLPARTVLLSVSGNEFAIENSASPIHDAGGELRGAVLVFHDISEQRRMTDRMTQRATHGAPAELAARSDVDARLASVV